MAGNVKRVYWRIGVGIGAGSRGGQLENSSSNIKVALGEHSHLSGVQRMIYSLVGHWALAAARLISHDSSLCDFNNLSHGADDVPTPVSQWPATLDACSSSSLAQRIPNYDPRAISNPQKDFIQPVSVFNKMRNTFN